MKIIGNTVGTSLPKPNMMQEDPRKGDYVKGKEEFLPEAIKQALTGHLSDANAGMLLYIGADGSVQPLSLGAGLEIADGVLNVTGTGGGSGGLVVDNEGNATIAGTGLTVDNDGNATL